MRNASKECLDDGSQVATTTVAQTDTDQEPSTTDPSASSVVSTTTPTSADSLGQLTASAYLEKQICRGESFNFKAPPDTLFVIEDSFYGITPHAVCEPLTQWHCKMPFVPDCNMQSSCFVHLKNEVIVPECAWNAATYMYIVYRFIPSQWIFNWLDPDLNMTFWLNCNCVKLTRRLSFTWIQANRIIWSIHPTRAA